MTANNSFGFSEGAGVAECAPPAGSMAPAAEGEAGALVTVATGAMEAILVGLSLTGRLVGSFVWKAVGRMVGPLDGGCVVGSDVLSDKMDGDSEVDFGDFEGAFKLIGERLGGSVPPAGLMAPADEGGAGALVTLATGAMGATVGVGHPPLVPSPSRPSPLFPPDKLAP